MSRAYRKIKPRHRYNEREEEMRVAMMLRRSWGRYRRRAGRGWPIWTAAWAKYVAGQLVPPAAKVDNPEPGVYVFEWRNGPLDAGGK